MFLLQRPLLLGAGGVEETVSVVSLQGRAVEGDGGEGQLVWLLIIRSVGDIWGRGLLFY